MIRRSELSNLIAEMLALQTARELDLLSFPSDEKMSACLVNARPAAEALLASYDQTVLTREIRTLIVEDVRSALTRRSWLTTAYQALIGLTTFAAAVMLSVSQFIYTPAANYQGVKALYYITLALQIVIFMLSVLLQVADRRG